MGLYSRNRLRNIAALEQINPDKDVDVIEIDDDVLGMLDGEDDDPSINIGEAISALESVEYIEEFTSLMETCININENDNDVIGSLIESDFATILKEQSIGKKASKDEESEKENKDKKQKIAENINKLFIGTELAIKEAAVKLAAKFDNLVEKDKALYEKYLNSFSEKKLNGLVIENFNFPNINSIKATNEVSEIKSLIASADTALIGIKNSTSKNRINEAFSFFFSELEIISENFNENISIVINNNRNWAPSKNNILFMNKFANGSIDMKKPIAITMQEYCNQLELLHSNILEYIEACDNSELGVYKVKEMYNVVSTVTKGAIKKFNTNNDLLVREFANIRKACLICGKYGTDKSIDEFIIEQLSGNSDAYVFDYIEN